LQERCCRSSHKKLYMTWIFLHLTSFSGDYTFFPAPFPALFPEPLLN